MPANPRWISVFADTADADAAVAFWTTVTATRRGEPAGARGEYLPLQPADGERYLWVQCTDDGPAAWHPDLHVPDLSDAALEATAGGATVIRATSELVVLTSPAGLPFCLFHDDRPAHRGPGPVRRDDGHASRLDQLCLDIAADDYDAECAFWTELTGWTPSRGSEEKFLHLDGPDGLAVRLALQRLDEAGDGPRAHADLVTDRRDAEQALHVAAGAVVVHEAADWTVLTAPGGHTYCITDGTP